MKALYKYEKAAGTTKLIDVPIPEIKEDDEVRVKVNACAVCGMDVHIYHGNFPPCRPPFICGHEFVGRVESLGKGATKLAVGDRVIAQPHHYACGECFSCKVGAPQYCKNNCSLGISRDGAMAEYVVVKEKYLHKIPDSIPDKFAVLIEPITISVSDVVMKAGLKRGETVAIIGAGQMGQLALVTSKYAGASKVFLTGVDNSLRLDAAVKLGADVVINAQKEDAIAKILELTDGRGVDLVVEASGSPDGINTAINITRLCGRMTLIGSSKKERIPVNWDAMLKKMLTLYFNMMSDYKGIGMSIDIIQNYPLDLSPLVTHEMPLEDWEEMFAVLSEGKGIKGVLHIG